MTHYKLWPIIMAGLALVLVGCSSPKNNEVIATPTIPSFEEVSTSIFLTQNAPPAGFSQVAFDPLDLHLSDHGGWVYQLTGSFDGIYDDSGQPVQGSLSIQVIGNEAGQTRRVLFEASGQAFLIDDAILTLEGVRFINDYYLVDVNGQCTVDMGGQAGSATIADLSAGQVIGGVARAVPNGHRMEIDGVPAWQYTFAPADVRLPAVHTLANSRVALAADLWIAPQYNAVLRYEVTVEVERVHLLWADQTAATVSGTLYLRYDLSIPDLGIQPNISVPHGC
ncbi:MAG: hypothetical protein HY866_20410 [Chloroflexi bacterium]|nr:hypothetical protein [Chloroflexota bacterium]